MDFAVAGKSLDRKYLQNRSKLLVSVVKDGAGGRALVEQILGWLSWKPVGDVLSPLGLVLRQLSSTCVLTS